MRTPEVYIIPRSDGRIVLGATVEEAGFDKRVDPDTVQRLHQAAANVAPAIGEMRIHEVWAGLRPGSPDDLPILGANRAARIFRGDRSLPRWNHAGANHRAGDEPAVDGAASRSLICGRFRRCGLGEGQCGATSSTYHS